MESEDRDNDMVDLVDGGLVEYMESEDRDNDMVDLVVVDGVLVELVDDDCSEYGVDAETVRSVMRDTVIPDMKKCWLSLLDESLVRIMVNLCGDWPKGRARELQGVARLMGGT